MKDATAFARQFESKDRLGALLGGRVLHLSAGECTYEYVVKQEHFNPNGILHGGALYSVMDSSQGAFLHFILESEYRFAATGTSTIRYLAPMKEGKIRIRTWLEGKERRKYFVRSSATNEAGLEIATLDEVWIAILK